LAASRCDVVHIQTPFAAHYAGLAAARSAGLPVLATYHTLFEEYLDHYVPYVPSGWLRGLARRFSRAQCNALDAVIVPSDAMQARLLDYGVRVPIEVLPTGIPLARFEAANGQRFRASHGLAPTQPLLLFVGRVAHEKNIGFLLEALQRVLRTHPRATLLVTGEGPALGELRAQVGAMRLENNVRFMGYLDRDGELADCYAAADLFVFSSRTETQGLVLLEAMAAGTPVVALSAMGTRDVLGPGLGCITPSDDPDDFARAVSRVLSDATLRAQLSEEAHAYARRWSDTTMATRLAQCYRSLSSARTQWKVHSRARPA
jgi:glycosyltransferase involved in cell wall biosynthesis